MATPSSAKSLDRLIPYSPPDATAELRFLTELGRSLLSSIHPTKVARRVAEAVREAIDADVCAFIAELPNIGLVSFAVGPNGTIEGELIDRTRFEKWLSPLPPQVAYLEENGAEFFVRGHDQRVEYVSPLHIDGEIRGAVVAGFAYRHSLTELRRGLIDAAAQMAAMSVNLSAHYEAAINVSISRAKEEHRKFTEAILDALPVSLYVVDRDFNIVTWNRHREIGPQGIPRDSAVGRNVFEVLSRYPQGRVRQEFERAFRTGKIERIEQQTTGDDGSTRHWVVSKVPMRDGVTDEISHVITVGEDVTVRVEAIHAVGRAEKLAAVGRLAAGVVHEINNPLATIAACAEALEQRVGEGAFEGSDAVDDLNEYLGLIKSETFRCKSITTGLLDFSRIRTGDRHAIDVGEILHSSANLISHQKRGERIDIRVEVDPDVSRINADGGQIQQAVIALGTNAIDAMPDGGTLTFRARSDRNRVAIEVEDTGVGIPTDDMSKIFEPFFTTKEVGRGTGLGLAVCYGIITDHGGRLSVRSNLGKGTVFTILIPAASRG